MADGIQLQNPETWLGYDSSLMNSNWSLFRLITNFGSFGWVIVEKNTRVKTRCRSFILLPTIFQV